MAETKAAATKAVAEAIQARTRETNTRCSRLAAAYITAAIQRALAVTTASELPPTAMKSAQLALIIAVLNEFDDVPTPAEIAALLRITPSAANALLNEVLATSDIATNQLLRAVFSRAEQVRKVNKDGKIANGKVWRFATLADLKLAKDRLEFQRVDYRTESTTDGVYELVIDPSFDTPT